MGTVADDLATAAALARMAHSLSRRTLKLAEEARRVTAELAALVERLETSQQEGDTGNGSNGKNQVKLTITAKAAGGAAANTEADIARGTRG